MYNKVYDNYIYARVREKNTWLTVMIHQIVNQDSGLIITFRISAE
jgi:hypothetical protein